MTYAIISDIHANEMALSAVMEDARRSGAQRIVCLGDVVGYGPEPEKTVSKTRSSAYVSVAGNHDDAVSGRMDPSDFIDLAADAAARHRESLSSENLAWLGSLPYVFEGSSFACAHGDFTSPESFNYVTDTSDAAANFAARREQLLFVGHSHVPGIFLTGASGKTYSLAPADFTLEDGKRYIVNPGSVGYPRSDDGVCESTYVLYDETERTITFRRIPFTVRSVMQTGRNPRRIKKRLIAAIAAVAAAAAGIVAWRLAPQERVETVREVVAIWNIDRIEKCGVRPEHRKLRMTAILSKGSPAAQIQLVFRDAGGKTLWEERWTAKKSRKATVRIPAGAAQATLSAGRASGDVPAAFDVFAIEPQ